MVGKFEAGGSAEGPQAADPRDPRIVVAGWPIDGKLCTLFIAGLGQRLAKL